MKFNHALVAFIPAAILMVGCGGSTTSFKSVPGPGENQGADANSSADASGNPAQPGDATAENGNGSDGGATTVVVGVGENPDSPDASVMTVSIDNGADSGTPGTENTGTAGNSETLPSDTDANSNGTQTDGDSTGTGTTATDTGTNTGTPNETVVDGASGNEPVTPGDKKDGTDDIVYDKLSKNAMIACTGKSDFPAEKVKVVSSKNTGAITVKADEYLAIHVSGNKPIVKLNTANAENATVKGICIFVAGNHARVEAVLGINVGSFGYFGTGNMSVGTVDVGEEVTIEKISAKLRGNQASLTISGEGKYDCGAVDLGGHNAKYHCGN